MSALDDWLKKHKSRAAADVSKMLGGEVKGNVKGVLGKAFLGFSAVEILKAEGALGKFKATLKAVLDFTLGMKIFAVSLFPMMRKGIQALVHDTGSLEAALKRLQKVQGLQRVFAPFLGGLEAAKRKVAELMLLNQRGPFSLDQWGAATKNLLATTRGVFTGLRQLAGIGDSAAATGNQVEDVADAVGGFYAALRNGEPIGAAVERLREMGVISDASATAMLGLAASGADLNDMTRELTGALEEHRGGMAAVKGELEAVQNAYEKAQTTLAEGFGGPFTEAEIENVKNYTDAMEALAPTVGRLGAFFQKLTGAFSTSKSSLVRWVAESDTARSVVEGLVKALALLVTVISGGAAYWLSSLAIKFAIASQMATGFGLALRGLAAAGGIALFVVAVATAVQVMMNFIDTQKQSEEAAEREARAHDEARRAMEARIAAIRNLTDQQEALARATAELYELLEKQTELKAAGEAEREQPWWKEAWKTLTGGNPREATEAEISGDDRIKAKRAEIERIFQKAGLAGGSAEQRMVELERQRAKALEDAELEARRSRGEDPLGLAREKLGVTQKRAGEAESGVAAAARVEQERAALEMEYMRLRTETSSRKILNAAEAAKLDAGFSAPETSAVFADTMASKIEHHLQSQDKSLPDYARARHETMAGGITGDARTLAWWREFASIQRDLENQLPQLSSDAVQEAASARLAGRDRMVDQFGLSREEDIAQALREGRGNEALNLRNLASFADRYEQARERYGDTTEAASIAQRLTNLEIERNQPEAIASSLQRIGGGGGVADPMLTIAEQQRDLQERMAEYLAAIAGATKDDTAAPNVPRIDSEEL